MRYDLTLLTRIAEQYSIPPAILNAVATQAKDGAMGMNPGAAAAYGPNAAAGMDPATAQLSMAARSLQSLFAQYGSWEPALSAYASGDSKQWQSPTSSVGGFVHGVLGTAAADPTLGMQGMTPADPSAFANMTKSLGTHMDELVSMGGVVSKSNQQALLTAGAAAHGRAVQATAGSAGSGQQQTRSGTQAPSFDPAVTAAITKVANQLGVPVNLALAIAQVESGGRPDTPGGGLYQLEVQGGEGAGMTPAQIADPTTNATRALTQVAAIMKANPGMDPGQIAALAQRPADRVGYAVKVNAANASPPATAQSSGASASNLGQWYGTGKWANTGAVENPATSGGALTDAPFAQQFDNVTQIFGPGGMSGEPTYGGIPQFHTGVDFSASGINGAPLKAVVAGTVHINQGGWGGGNFVTITAPNGWSYGYGHEGDFAGLTDGQQVTAGQVIAHAGSTGMSTGPHLHFEVRTPDGTLIDGTPYVQAALTGAQQHPQATTPPPGMAPSGTGAQGPAPEPGPDAIGQFAMQLQGMGVDPQHFAQNFPVAAAQYQRFMGTALTLDEYQHMAGMNAQQIQQYVMSLPHPTYPEHTAGAMANMHAAASLQSVPLAGKTPNTAEAARLLSAGAGWNEIGKFYASHNPAPFGSATNNTATTPPAAQNPWAGVQGQTDIATANVPKQSDPGH